MTDASILAAALKEANQRSRMFAEHCDELTQERDRLHVGLHNSRLTNQSLTRENGNLREMADRYLKAIQTLVKKNDELIDERDNYQSLFEAINRIHIHHRLREKGNEMEQSEPYEPNFLELSEPGIAPPPRFELDAAIDPIRKELDSRMIAVVEARSIIEETLDEIETRDAAWAQKVREKCSWLSLLEG